MERPQSASNRDVAQPSTHKRTASKQLDGSARANHGPTVVSLFVRNVRLLNLDLLDDWPGVTPASLGNHDARTRIRNTEWCLYQLFRLHDPHSTTEKLQPFFPPLEPLQSINLRAALYRCLNELKKNGVLGRETVLRKSMLDDCQGEKFWELCLGFSTTVLRKIAVDQHNAERNPVAERLGTAQTLNRSQRESMLPLAIAHRAALSKILSEKERKRRSLATLSGMFAEKEVELKQRILEIQEWTISGQVEIQVQQGRVAEKTLEKHWVGSEELRDAIINGDEAAAGDAMLAKPFEEVWKTGGHVYPDSPGTAELGILEDLELRTRQQKRRLQKWQLFHEKLLSSKPQLKRASTDLSKASQLCFDRHQELTIRDMEYAPKTSPVRHEKPVAVSKYDEILTQMREELREKSASRQSSAPEAITQPKRPPMRAHTISSGDTRGGAQGPHARRPSQTAVPVRPAMNRRVSSRSRSYQQPKVVSQRELVPLKSEIFSPLKWPRPGSASPASGSSLLPSPVEESSSGSANEDGVATAAQISRPSSVVHQHRDSIAGSAIRSSSRLSHESTPSSPRTGQGGHHPDSAVDLPTKPDSLATKSIDSLGRTVRPSLADRTRMSMAFKSADDIDVTPIKQSQPSLPLKGESDSPGSSSDPEPTPLPTCTTLLDRTRQSMSAAPAPVPAPRSRKSQHTRSRTSIFPVNQFETPQRKPRRSTVNAADPQAPSVGQSGRSFTPRENLFDEDAEYASVFKARPKVALSPVLSPREGEKDVAEEGGLDGDAFLDDVGASSPLARVRG